MAEPITPEPRGFPRKRALAGSDAHLVSPRMFVVIVVFMLSGAAGLVYESVWSRYLALFVGHSAHAQVIVLVIFLGGMSAGAYVASRHSHRVRRPLLMYAYVEFAIGVIAILFI